MPWLGQCDDADRGDIAGVDERNLAVAGRGVDDPIVDDVVSLAQEVLHEMVWSKHRPRQACFLQLCLDLIMHAPDHGIRPGRRPKGGKLHHLSDTRLAGCREGMALQLVRVFTVAGEQKQFGAAREHRG